MEMLILQRKIIRMDKIPEIINVKNHKSIVRQFDYVMVQGEIYKVIENDFKGDIHLKRVESIPKEYHDYDHK